MTTLSKRNSAADQERFHRQASDGPSVWNPIDMKTVQSLRPLWVLAIIVVGIVSGQSQSFSIPMFTIDGGGGGSTGGAFSVSGTIGQPDAGVLAGGAFTLRGGFWGAIVTIPVDDVPMLSVELTAPGQVRVSWDPVAPDFVLQYTDDLGLKNWTRMETGGTNSATMNTTPSVLYFRLQKP